MATPPQNNNQNQKIPMCPCPPGVDPPETDEGGSPVAEGTWTDEAAAAYSAYKQGTPPPPPYDMDDQSREAAIARGDIPDMPPAERERYAHGNTDPNIYPEEWAGTVVGPEPEVPYGQMPPSGYAAREAARKEQSKTGPYANRTRTNRSTRQGG